MLCAGTPGTTTLFFMTSRESLELLRWVLVFVDPSADPLMHYLGVHSSQVELRLHFTNLLTQLNHVRESCTWRSWRRNPALAANRRHCGFCFSKRPNSDVLGGQRRVVPVPQQHAGSARLSAAISTCCSRRRLGTTAGAADADPAPRDSVQVHSWL